jgi:hypothetical protein
VTNSEVSDPQSSRAVKVVVATTVLLSFISFWRAAASGAIETAEGDAMTKDVAAMPVQFRHTGRSREVGVPHTQPMWIRLWSNIGLWV